MHRHRKARSRSVPRKAAPASGPMPCQTHHASVEAGVRAARLDPRTGQHVVIYDGLAQVMDTSSGRWQTVCEAHGWVLSHLTLAIARDWYRADPAEWCDECGALASA